MLPKYANLENDANNFVQASRTIHNYNKQTASNLQQERNPSSSGISPKNEYEEFNSNLTEINTYITQLKTYVNDNKKKEFNNQLRDAQHQNYEIDRADERGEATGEKKINIIDNSDFYYNIIDKEAKRIGTLPNIKLVNLHQTGDYNKNEVEMFKQVQGSGRHLVGGGETERQEFEEQIQELNDINTELYRLDKTFKNLYEQLRLEEDPTTKQDIEQELSELIDMTRGDFGNFPTTNKLNDVSDFLKNQIASNTEKIKQYRKEISDDFVAEGKQESAGQKISREQLKKDISEIDGMTVTELQELKDKYNITDKRIGKPGVKKILEAKLVAVRTEIEQIRDPFITSGQEQSELIKQIEEEKQQRLKELDDELNAVTSKIEAELARREAVLEQFKEEQRIAREAVAKALDDAAEAQRLSDLADAQRETDRLARVAQNARREAELQQKAAELAQKRAVREQNEIAKLALRQKEIEEAIAQALIETEATAELTRKKAVGALASSVPNVNPIIGTLTKLITLVSKQNILFNSKIKKNINLLDRLDVEDLISKLNKTISNLTNINFSYIIVSIENGYEMLEQLFTALNKLSFDVSNSVYNYTSSLRGGTRYINDHLQHFKFRGMSSNPHPYYYMM
jgi:hypothetical protein